MKKSVVLSFLLMFSMLYSSVVSAAPNNGDYLSEQLTVSVDNAEMAAKRFIVDSQFDSNWFDSDLKLTETFYDVDESILGYYFSLYKNGTNVGHIVVSASKDREPILRFGSGEIELSKENGSNAYYLGSQIIYSDSMNNIINSIERSKSNIDVADLSVPKDEATYKPQWDYYLAENQESYINTFVEPKAPNYPTQKELSVTRIYQRGPGIPEYKTACGPATGAMIANYYKSRGYNIRGSSYYGSTDAGLVNHLYAEMNSGTFGTSYNDYASGIFQHLRHDGSTQWSGLGYQDSRSHYVEYKDAIYTNRPVALRYDFFVSNNENINYHFVVGMAYKEVNGTNYLGIKDPDNGANNTSTNYYSWSSHSGDFAMHILMAQQ